jgi:serine/threonine protein phosphatase 1
LGVLGFLKKRKPTPPPVRSAPEGVRLYAVGDVHGRHDLLMLLIAAITEDAADAAEPKFIFLGDYIDRGPQSREVIDSLIALSRRGLGDCVFLRGNHDETLLRFVADANVGRSWCNYGGAETLESYGVSPPLMITDPDAWERTRVEFVERLGPQHLAFFDQLGLYAEFGDYFFVHAGARPGVALGEQDASDLLWIREDFLRPGPHFEKAIVHGHTPEPDAFVSARRIGVDTGAYASGILTAVVLEGQERRLLQARIQQGRASVHRIDIATPVPETPPV